MHIVNQIYYNGLHFGFYKICCISLPIYYIFFQKGIAKSMILC